MKNNVQRIKKIVSVSAYEILLLSSAYLPFFDDLAFEMTFYGLIFRGVAIVYVCSLFYFVLEIWRKRGPFYKMVYGFLIFGYIFSVLPISTFLSMTIAQARIGFVLYFLSFPLLIISHRIDDTPKHLKNEKMIDSTVDITDKYFLGHGFYVRDRLHKLVGTIDYENREVHLGIYLKEMKKEIIKFGDIKKIEISVSENYKSIKHARSDEFAKASIMNFLIHEFSVFIACDELANRVDKFFDKKNIVEMSEVKIVLEKYETVFYTSEDFINLLATLRDSLSGN